MKKIFLLAFVALLIRLIFLIYYIPIFEKSDISQKLDELKVYKFLVKINNQRPFQSNIDIQYFSEIDLKDNFIIKSYSKRSIRMNDDEEQNYAIAVNYLKGNNYSIFDHDKQKYRYTAQQHSFQIFIYKYFIDKEINFDYFIFIYIFINLTLFFLSVIFFYKTSLIFLNENFSKISTLIYCFYPSIFFYIGPLFFYENLVLSMIVISSYLLLKKKDLLNFSIIIIFAVLSLLLRFQTIFIWLLLFAIFTFYDFSKHRNANSFLPILFFILAVYVAHKPILDKNYILFDNKTLTTNSGLSFFIGANEYARGSWDGTGRTYNQFKSKLDDSLNDLEISKIYFNAGIEWIKKNPLDYLILQFRKLAIYFLPQNYSILPGNRIYNPINFIIHMGLFLFVINLLIKKEFSYKNLIILSPVMGSLIVSLLFFIGYRWRYYAEPFMILTAIIYFSELKKIFRK